MNEIRLDIPYKFTPRPYQLPLFNSINNGYKRAVAVWHRRAGKDKTLVNIIVREMTRRVGLYWYVFPYYSQGRKILWEGMDRSGMPFLDHIPPQLIENRDNAEMWIKLKNGSILRVVGSDRKDTIVGANPVGCVFSEYSLQKPEVWPIISPILIENGGWAVFNYTPRGHNHGFELYNKALTREDWFAELLTVEDTQAIPLHLVHKELEEGLISKELWLQEYFCSWQADQTNQIIPWDCIQAGMDRYRDTPREEAAHIYDGWPVIIGVDVARHGPNYSATCVRQGYYVHDLWYDRNVDTMQLARVVLNKKNQYNADVTFVDDIGVGGGTVDYLRMLKQNVIGINSGSTSIDKKFENLRGEMWISCRDWLKEGGMIPNDRNLIDELSVQTFEYNKHNQVELPSKRWMLKNGMRSPDVAESLVYTFAMPIQKSRVIDELEYEDDTIEGTRNEVTGY